MAKLPPDGGGTVGNRGDINKELRDSRIKWIHTDDSRMGWAFERITKIVNEVNPQYFGMDLQVMESLQLTEYDSDYLGHYGAHTDCSYENHHSRNRKLSITVQLSHPDEYEGGELNLYWNDIKHPAIASKGIGTMTLFRSHILHEVMPVTKGKRMSLVTWVQGPLFK